MEKGKEEKKLVKKRRSLNSRLELLEILLKHLIKRACRIERKVDRVKYQVTCLKLKIKIREEEPCDNGE